jgi:hypothetical protein
MKTADHTAPEQTELLDLEYWSCRFAKLLTRAGEPASWPAGEVIGLEHEYRVLVDHHAVDFGSVVHRLRLGQPLLDPADLNAYRLASGAALTADEAEAEIALSPMFVRPGCFRDLAARASSERRALASRLPAGARLEGYSSHLSVAVAPSYSVAMAKLYAASFSASLMLLMDSAPSPGLLVRPRASRLELGGEFVDGQRLVVAAIFAVGSVRACRYRLEKGYQGDFPDRLCVQLQRDDQRYGWFVSRSAFARDLYASGRETPLRLERGSIAAQAHLERCWSAARATLVRDVAESELELVDEVIRGKEPLPVAHPSVLGAAAPPDEPVEDDALAQAFGAAAQAHSRPGYDLAPVMLTWDRAVFVVSTPERNRIAFATVSAPLLPLFFSQLQGGALDEAISSYLELAPGARRLRGWPAAPAIAGLYDDLAPRARLLVPERAPRAVGWAPRHPVSRATRRGRSAARHGAGAEASGGHA